MWRLAFKRQGKGARKRGSGFVGIRSIRKFADFLVLAQRDSQNVIRLPFAVMVGFLTDLVIEPHASFVFDNTDRVWYYTVSE